MSAHLIRPFQEGIKSPTLSLTTVPPTIADSTGFPCLSDVPLILGQNKGTNSEAMQGSCQVNGNTSSSTATYSIGSSSISLDATSIKPSTNYWEVLSLTIIESSTCSICFGDSVCSGSYI